MQCTYNMSKYLVKRGHDVTVYATDALRPRSDSRVPERIRVIEGAKVHFFPIVTGFCEMFITPSLIPALRRHLGEFDVVHLHEVRSFQNIAFLLCRSKVGPYVVQTHGIKLPEHAFLEGKPHLVAARRAYQVAFGRGLLKGASKVVAYTNSERKLLQTIGVDTSRIVTIPNAVSPEDYCDPSPMNPFEDEHVKVILYVGRVNRTKGIETLVKAFHLLAKHRTDVRLAIVGPDDGYLEELREIVDSFGLADKVLFTGLVSHERKVGAYYQADVVVYPGMYEGFPIVPLEAAIMAKPLVVSTDPGMDFVREGKFGLTFPYGNEYQLENALETLLGDAHLARELGERGKKCVLKNYTWDIVTDAVEQLYRDICEDSRGLQD